MHRLIIRRGNQLIDVLKSGQTFTTLRRETNLDAGMLDGQLTASLMPEGLQVGDVVELACTYVHVDPATKDSAEIEMATFNDSPIGRGTGEAWPGGARRGRFVAPLPPRVPRRSTPDSARREPESRASRARAGTRPVPPG